MGDVECLPLLIAVLVQARHMQRGCQIGKEGGVWSVQRQGRLKWSVWGGCLVCLFPIATLAAPFMACTYYFILKVVNTRKQEKGAHTHNTRTHTHNTRTHRHTHMHTHTHTHTSLL